MWIFRIVFSYVLAKFLGLGVLGVWIAMTIDWLFRAICFSIRFIKGKWKLHAFVA
jgi:Na+-driven multidrug efflux pump